MQNVELPETRPAPIADSAADFAPAPRPVMRNEGNTARQSWNFALDSIQANCSHYDEATRTLLVAAYRWCVDVRHPIAREDFAKQVGSSDNLIYKIFTGRYTHPTSGNKLPPSPDLLASIKKFLELEKHRYQAGATDLVITPTLRQIVTACDLARESNTFCFLVGPSHIGKTWALEKYYQPNNNHGSTIYTRMETGLSQTGVIKLMAKDFGLGTSDTPQELRHRLHNGPTKNMLWILDEMHLLSLTAKKGAFHRCCEFVREIHDKTKCGMVASFTILDEVKASSQKELQQLWRRGVHKVFLPALPTVGDLTAILNHNGLDFPDRKFKVSIRFATASGGTDTIEDVPYKILHQLARRDGLLAITERLRYARLLAKTAREDFAWKHFVRAHLIIEKQGQQDMNGGWE